MVVNLSFASFDEDKNWFLIKTIDMEIIHNPWEFETVVEKGSYTLRKADPATRAKQLQEHKEKREKELLKELRELEMLR